MTMNDHPVISTATRAKVETIWNRIPNVKCKGLCGQSCGPIMMSDVEEAIIRDKLGFLPDFLPLSLTCPMYELGGCSIYKIRPAICRLYGCVSQMCCPHGCQPDWPFLNSEGKAILHELENLPIK